MLFEEDPQEISNEVSSQSSFQRLSPQKSRSDKKKGQSKKRRSSLLKSVSLRTMLCSQTVIMNVLSRRATPTTPTVMTIMRPLKLSQSLSLTPAQRSFRRCLCLMLSKIKLRLCVASSTFKISPDHPQIKVYRGYLKLAMGKGDIQELAELVYEIKD